MKFSTFAAVLAVAGLCVSAQAAGVSVGGDFKTAYVATGVTCNDGPVFQPWVDVYDCKIGDLALPLTFEFWGNMDLDDDYASDPEYGKLYKSGRFSEIDLSLDLDLGAFWTPSEDFTWSIGYLEYDYPRLGDETDHLINFKMKYACLLNPKFQAKYRFAGNSKEKCEMLFEVSHSFDLGNDFGLDLSADCWYVIQAEHSDLDDGFACADFTASLTFKAFYVSATYVAQIDDDVLPDADAFGYDVEWIGSLGVSYDF